MTHNIFFFFFKSLPPQVFCSQLTDEAARGSFPTEVVRNIFSNVSSIYVFHSQFLLPDLEKCIRHWWVDVSRTTRVVLPQEAVEEGSFTSEEEKLKKPNQVRLQTPMTFSSFVFFFPPQSRRERPGLGNVLLQHAPFLRMYADYVKNFDQAMELVRTWTVRSAAFRNIIQDIQV